MILAPVSGWFGPLAEAPDPVFAEGMMGAGGLVDPIAGELRAPCDGVILTVPGSLHAVTLRGGNGAEILLHVGIETVALQGRGFTAHVSEGDKVSAGDLLLSFDLDILADHATSLQTPVVVANQDEGYSLSQMAAPGPVNVGDPLFTVMRSAAPRQAQPAAAAGSSVNDDVLVLLANGIHARPAARLADLAKQFEARGWLVRAGKRGNVRSPVALMTLGIGHGDMVGIETTGADAGALMSALKQAIEAGLGEITVPLRSAGSDMDEARGTRPDAIALDGTSMIAGVSAAPGLVIGPVKGFEDQAADIAEMGQGVGIERAALSEATAQVSATIGDRLERAKGQEAEILRAHLVLLDDETLTEQAMALVGEGKSAAFAWHSAIQRQVKALKALDDALLVERADDLSDLESQVIAAIAGGRSDGAASCHGAIIVAEELYPSQFLVLAEAGAAGICLTGGGATSHVAILAAEKGIPALVAADRGALTIPDGTPVILSCDTGMMHVAPRPDILAETEQGIARRQSNMAKAAVNAAEPAMTQDGHRIEVFANLGGGQGARDAVANGAEGCGLLRTEFLYMSRATPPGEDEQAAAYQAIADDLDGRPLVIRTLDIGGDKPASFVRFPKEDNPALGLRGVRLTLRRRDLLETQLRAILRVKSANPIQIMLPMVTSIDEVAAVREVLRSLEAGAGASRSLPLGIMVETPASAVTARALAPHVDFFSIGTNDLTQYALAMDRGNPQLAAQVDSFHPAVLNLIAMTAEAGAAHGKWVGVCGSMASHPLAAPVLAGMGVTELSATIRSVPVIKAVLRSVTMEDCRALAGTALEMESADAVRAHILSVWPHLRDWM
ncbi:phosphoenolpyruvate--protein phosphotransferase [Aquisalinus flavus]|uniref:phosphoenolpyruvate--protein phosphotransferase n=2 Tax=Aquisalinus flavus TaxID=1526572 RepID=A0A8J2V497_9PROT|nr:phosphoenolpyruvate--protein phosphotransferase [Aquisalinus flavus]GGD00727.1 phosphoenolpyruvate--protein phosphotransferase [Aquisalinus flavus]